MVSEISWNDLISFASSAVERWSTGSPSRTLVVLWCYAFMRVFKFQGGFLLFVPEKGYKL